MIWGNKRLFHWLWQVCKKSGCVWCRANNNNNNKKSFRKQLVILYGAICSEFIIHHNLCQEQRGEWLWELGFFGGYHQVTSLCTSKPLDFTECDATAAFSIIYILKICNVTITFIFRHKEWLYSCLSTVMITLMTHVCIWICFSSSIVTQEESSSLFSWLI